MKIRIIIMLALVLAFTGCTSFHFGLSQSKGLQISIKGAPPTLYKILSVEKETGSGFDLFHFQAEGAEDDELEDDEAAPADPEDGGNDD